MKNELQRITLDLPLELAKKLKIIATLQNTTMRDIIIKALEKELFNIREDIDNFLEDNE